MAWHQGPQTGRDHRQKLSTEKELLALNNLVEQYLIFAEGQAMRRVPMHMVDWIKKLDAFLTLNEREILTHAGSISHEMAKEMAETEHQKFNRRRIRKKDHLDGDFEKTVKQLTNGKRGEKKWTYPMKTSSSLL